MTRKEIITLIVWHTLFFVAGTVLYILLFHTRILSNAVFFYRGIALLFIAVLVTGSALLYFRRISYGKLFTFRDVLLSLIILFSCNMIFFTHVPVTADRSISVFLLGYMNAHSNELLSADRISNAFEEIYVQDHHALEKRFNEQITSGNIVQEEGSYHITKQGETLIQFYNFVSKLFAINKKNLSP